MGFYYYMDWFPVSVSKQDILKECKERAAKEGGILRSEIEFCSGEPYRDYRDAETFLNRSGGNKAVKFYSFKKLSSPKYESISKKYDRVSEKIKKLENEHPFQGIKSAFVSCKHCGTKLNVKEFLGNKKLKNKCPVCENDLRSETKLKLIESLERERSVLYNQRDLEKEALKDAAIKDNNFGLYWEVRFEFQVR